MEIIKNIVGIIILAVFAFSGVILGMFLCTNYAIAPYAIVIIFVLVIVWEGIMAVLAFFECKEIRLQYLIRKEKRSDKEEAELQELYNFCD